VLTSTTRRLVTALSLLIAGCASSRPTAATSTRPAAAPDSSMAGHDMAGHDMAGMDMSGMPGHAMGAMSTPVRIPAGALFTEADVRFMQGMIAHHGQAIYMSRLAASRGASPRMLRFTQKIDQSQAAEIRLMQEWLVANGQTAPDSGSWRSMTMPGMLTAAQLAALEAARGAAFDEQFLRLMIQHHEGALRMVADLLATPRAAQDVDVSVLANDVETTQTAEIGLMRQMLATLRDPSNGAR
jgi:uncharacterized protein (DUF305 family)